MATSEPQGGGQQHGASAGGVQAVRSATTMERVANPKTIRSQDSVMDTSDALQPYLDERRGQCDGGDAREEGRGGVLHEQCAGGRGMTRMDVIFCVDGDHDVLSSLSNISKGRPAKDWM